MLELRELAEMQTQDVRFDVALHRAELDPGDDSNAESRSRGRSIGEAGNRVVIGECEGDQPDGARRNDDVRGRAGPVGCGRVRMKIDEFVLRCAPNERRITHDV